MLYLLLGTDEFSKKEFLEQLAKNKKAEIERIDSSAMPRADYFLQATLFGGAKLFVIEGAAAFLEENLESFKQSSHNIVFVEKSLDKRKKATTKLLNDKDITIKEFAPPYGPELNAWINKRLKLLGTTINPDAIKLLLTRLVAETSPSGYGDPEVDLWLMDSELKKLATFAAGQPITTQMVGALIVADLETGVFEIINAAAEKQRQATSELLENFFKTADGSDEKSKIIQLNAVLSDQLRSLFLYKSFVEQRAPDSEILKQTGWKSGRLYVMKRLAQKFTPEKLRSLLSKLESLDMELKTSGTPPRVLLDLIMAQMII